MDNLKPVIADFLNSPDAKFAVAITKHFNLPYAGNAVFDGELMEMIANFRMGAIDKYKDALLAMAKSYDLGSVESRAIITAIEHASAQPEKTDG